MSFVTKIADKSLMNSLVGGVRYFARGLFEDNFLIICHLLTFSKNFYLDWPWKKIDTSFFDKIGYRRGKKLFPNKKNPNFELSGSPRIILFYFSFSAIFEKNEIFLFLIRLL